MKSSKYKELVNFKKNLNIPRHSWFEIKEGYSADLVNNLINDLKIKKNLDIFLIHFLEVELQHYNLQF